MVGFTLVFTMPGYFSTYLYRAVRPNGPLEQLGLGSKRVAQKQVASLQKLRWVLVAATVPAVLFMLQFNLTMIVSGWGWLIAGKRIAMMADAPGCYCDGDVLALPDAANVTDLCQPNALKAAIAIGCFPIICANYLVGMVSAATWFMSLKVAVALAHDDVIEVVNVVTSEALSDETLWTEGVARPTIALATDTMRSLSAGWGTGTAFAFLLPWVIAFTNFLTMVHQIVTKTDYADHARHGLVVFVMACFPLLLARDVAAVSSLCDTLLARINNLRLRWRSSSDAEAVHARTYPLQCTLRELNHGQGLGFVLLGKVMDTRTLNLLFFSLVSFFSTAVPILISMLPDPSAQGGGNGEAGTGVAWCVADEMQAQVVASVFRNGSCGYNQSIDEVLLQAALAQQQQQQQEEDEG